MKTLCMVLLLTVTAFAQENVGRSKPGRLVPKKELPVSVSPSKTEPGKMEYYTPFLVANLTYTDPSGNNFLDANEEWQVILSLKNIGKMTAERCDIKLLSSPDDPNLSISGMSLVKKIDPGEERFDTMRIKANEDIQTGQRKFTLQVKEKNGFDLDPEKILIVPTREFQPPKLEIVDYGIDDLNRNLKIEEFEKVDVTVRIQNRGENVAKNAKAYITLGENVVALDVPTEYPLGDLKSGEYKDIKATIATNARATEVKIDVAAKEQTGKYSAYRTINLPFDQVQKKSDEIIVAKGEEKGIVVPEATLAKLDIAENIPVAAEKKDNAVAVIIGNKDYTAAPTVEFALNDAAIVRNYVISAFGYREENIIYLENAKQSDLVSVFGNEQNYKGRLYDYSKKGLSEVFIYYSGHGAPDPDSKQGYLVPVDCDPNRVSLNGYSLSLLYQNLDKTAVEKQLKQVTIVLDACFSGRSEKGSLLTNVSPVYVVVEKQGMTYPNASIFTSATGDQVSTWYTEKKQSLFTYFFLRGLKGEADLNKDGKITTLELYQYTADEVNGVPYWSRRLNPGRTQTPTFSGKDVEIEK